MNVPPYIPQQIEIPGNVAEERYAVRVNFVRRVVFLHTTFYGFIFATTFIPISTASWPIGAIIFVVSLLALSLVRGVAKGWRHEQLLSSLCVPALVVGLSLLTRQAVESGIPLWAFALVPGAMLGYALLCGRDWSFVGMFVIGSMSVTGGLLGVGYAQILPWPQVLELWLAMEAYALFYVYDLAALQTRRRLGEEVGAVLDLFRDLLNFTTYPIRVVNHWRRHRIWSLRG